MTASNNASSSLNDVNIRQRKLGHRRTEIAAHLDPAAVRQADVEHGDVGRRRRRALSASAAVPASPTTSRSSAVSSRSRPSPDHFVVVDEKHPDHDSTALGEMS